MSVYFVVSDVHSFYLEMVKALKESGFDPENETHIFVSLGDLFDRGPESKNVLEFVNRLPDNRKILIKGNHEDLLEDALSRGFFVHHDWHNGTDKTVYQLSGINDNDSLAIEKCRKNKELKKYLESCINYYETKKYIFVHGWIPEINDWKNGDWNQARWKCCFDEWYKGVVIPNKTIVAGHWHTSYGHSKYHNNGPEWDEEQVEIFRKFYPKKPIRGTACFDIFTDKGIIALDACTVYSRQVNCLRLERVEGI